ncbi:hypothetical protein BS78_02G117600 [Paspalum vaginatum]|nr:hypothetical protein BS78_02G117600 [Paspalum vaginatum]
MELPPRAALQSVIFGARSSSPTPPPSPSRTGVDLVGAGSSPSCASCRLGSPPSLRAMDPGHHRLELPLVSPAPATPTSSSARRRVRRQPSRCLVASPRRCPSTSTPRHGRCISSPLPRRH